MLSSKNLAHTRRSFRRSCFVDHAKSHDVRLLTTCRRRFNRLIKPDVAAAAVAAVAVSAAHCLLPTAAAAAAAEALRFETVIAATVSGRALATSADRRCLFSTRVPWCGRRHHISPSDRGPPPRVCSRAQNVRTSYHERAPCTTPPLWFSRRTRGRCFSDRSSKVKRSRRRHARASSTRDGRLLAVTVRSPTPAGPGSDREVALRVTSQRVSFCRRRRLTGGRTRPLAAFWQADARCPSCADLGSSCPRILVITHYTTFFVDESHGMVVSFTVSF